jgi:hypothetical protein
MVVLFSGLIASSISLVVTVLMNLFFQRQSAKKKLGETLSQLNQNILNNPFLENDESLERYLTGDQKVDMALRDKYNIYCIMKLNYLEELSRFHGFKLKNITKGFHLKEYLKDNAKWWSENRQINYEAYDKRFIHMIEEVQNEA